MASPSNILPSLEMNDGEEQVETSPLAFTVQFDDPKPEGRKLKIHDKLSSFALKHRRNPSLPDFKAVKNISKLELIESKPSSLNFMKLGKHLATPKAGYHSEGYFSSDQDEESIKLRSRPNYMPRAKVSPVTEDKGFLPHVNGANASEPSKAMKSSNLRRSSMNDLNLKEMLSSTLNSTFTIDDTEERCTERVVECDKSDTVSEAGTYTVEKDGNGDINSKVCESVLPNNDEAIYAVNSKQMLTPENHKWINDWVKKVAEQSLINPPNDTSHLPESGSSSASASKIPSPINTMPKIREPVILRRSERLAPNQSKVNGSFHRRSSSLSAKDFSENRTSDSSLETESYLVATESVMTAMQNRMRQTLKLNLAADNGKKGSVRKERLHPPSTASDTDTNSENDAKVFKKPQGAIFNSARLNRAFSLRRARADLEADDGDHKKRNTPSPVIVGERRSLPAKSNSSSQVSKAKTSVSAPFNRTDVGRFSMRSTSASKGSNTPCAVGVKKDVKKPGTGGRSNSSLSSREMEFQNWKRRKSFDPMKAAAEGRKKEAARKAAVSQSLTNSSSPAMTQSVNLGTTVQPRSRNAVLRSASFHTSQHLAISQLDIDDDLSPGDPEDEPSSPVSLGTSHEPILPPNSPNRVVSQRVDAQLQGSGSRGSLNSAISEVQSSPSRRARAEFIDNLLISAIGELAIGLKIKSNDILKKLDAYNEGDERIARMREELLDGDSQRGSVNSSPAHRSHTRDFPAILKNLKTLENVLHVLDDVLFGETADND